MASLPKTPEPTGRSKTNRLNILNLDCDERKWELRLLAPNSRARAIWNKRLVTFDAVSLDFHRGFSTKFMLEGGPLPHLLPRETEVANHLQVHIIWWAHLNLPRPGDGASDLMHGHAGGGFRDDPGPYSSEKYVNQNSSSISSNSRQCSAAQLKISDLWQESTQETHHVCHRNQKS